MSFSLQKLSDEPIAILTLDKGFNFVMDLPQGDAEAISFLDQCDEPVFWIVHLIVEMDMEALLLGTRDVSHGPTAVWNHPSIREVLLVSEQEVVHMAAPGLNTETFGYLNVKAFRTLPEALDYARAQI